MLARSESSTINLEVRPSLMLRMLAGLSCMDMMMSYQVHALTIFQNFHTTCDALMKRLKIPGLISTKFCLLFLENGFKRSLSNPISGCVGALDGICVKIKKPVENELRATFTVEKSIMRCHFKRWLIENTSFSISGRLVDATYDYIAHAMYSLGEYLVSGSLNFEFCIAGD